MQNRWSPYGAYSEVSLYGNSIWILRWQLLWITLAIRFDIFLKFWQILALKLILNFKLCYIIPVFSSNLEKFNFNEIHLTFYSTKKSFTNTVIHQFSKINFYYQLQFSLHSFRWQNDRNTDRQIKTSVLSQSDFIGENKDGQKKCKLDSNNKTQLKLRSEN